MTRREQLKAEIEHQRNLLSIHNRNLQYTEQQIALHGPLNAPLWLHNQRVSEEEAKTKVLERLAELERRLDEACPASTPEAEGTLDVKVELFTRSLPTGLLHLYSAQDLPLVQFSMRNGLREMTTVILTSWIEDYSYHRTDTVSLAGGQQKTVTQLPILKPEATYRVREVRKGALHTRISYLRDDSEHLHSHQSYELELLARDVLIWALRTEDRIIDLSKHVAAWVTPNAPAVIEMLRVAADHHPRGKLWGYQGEGSLAERTARTRGQVNAIFEALKAEGQITYIDAPISFGRDPQNIQQRVNFPADSLRYRQANCLDGAVLYASLLERASIHPVIVLIPGHAFVGWEVWKRTGTYEYLETTMTGSHTFDEARKRGMREFDQARDMLDRPLFDPSGYARRLDIVELHKQGTLPSPLS